MTSVDGSNATDGGARWMYDVTLYPKNLTGIPTWKRPCGRIRTILAKQWLQRYHRRLRPHRHRPMVMWIDYQLISTLPSITSESTYLTCYTFVDTLSKGLTLTRTMWRWNFDGRRLYPERGLLDGGRRQVQWVLHYYGTNCW